MFEGVTIPWGCARCGARDIWTVTSLSPDVRRAVLRQVERVEAGQCVCSACGERGWLYIADDQFAVEGRTRSPTDDQLAALDPGDAPVDAATRACL